MKASDYKNPSNAYRIYRLVHAGTPADWKDRMEVLLKEGYGGTVINAAFNDHYLQDDQDLADVDRKIEINRSMGLGCWLYDEKGYPSGSADGLTLAGHPEYESHGFTVLSTNRKPYTIEPPFERILYATDEKGNPVPFTDTSAASAAYCYVIAPVFEGSHAHKCGYGPRRYPNLMSKEAIASFIRCTYDRYYDTLKHFDAFEAVFTDEPSLMSGYVNCETPMPYVFLPWEDTLPEVFQSMHGISLFAVIGELFDETDTFRPGKVMFWKTVAHMVDEAFFKQIAAWCASHNIPFSGHCLLEESISMHVPLYGDLLHCLKSFDYPGVDMLTGDPEAFLHSPGFPYCLAAKYVGSAARMTGKTEKVMVEICPLTEHRGGNEYTLEEEIGTMDLIFLSGINHINSYLDHSRLQGHHKEYADYFARAAYVLRGARWVGKIGMYYPIETVQGHYIPPHIGINNGPSPSKIICDTEASMFRLYHTLYENGFDFTIVDDEWLTSATCENGALMANGLEITALVLPHTMVVSDALKARLEAFTASGGTVLWCDAVPENVKADICESPIPTLKNVVDYGLSLEVEHPNALFVSPYTKDGKRVYYLINTSGHSNTVSVCFADGAAFEVWHNIDGKATSDTTFTLAPHTSVFVVEK